MVSSSLIVMNPQHSVSAAGMNIHVVIKISTEIMAPMPSIAKSRSDQNHRFAFAFRFCGYKYVVNPAPPYLIALVTVLDRLTAVVVAWTTFMTLTLTLESNPNCCAILGTSLPASMTPSPNSIFVGKVKSPK